MSQQEWLEQLDYIAQQLQTLRAAIASSGEFTIPDTIAQEDAAGICHYCKQPIGEEQSFRGDHSRCYKTIYRAVKDGETTWEQAVAAGWLAPKKPSGRRRADNPIRAMKKAADAYLEAVADKLPPARVAEEKQPFKKKPKPKT